MANNKELFRTNANHLQKVLNNIKLSQDMNGGQKILGETNQKILLQAENKVSEAINLLRSIK